MAKFQSTFVVYRDILFVSTFKLHCNSFSTCEHECLQACCKQNKQCDQISASSSRFKVAECVFV